MSLKFQPIDIPYSFNVISYEVAYFTGLIMEVKESKILIKWMWICSYDMAQVFLHKLNAALHR